jgi:hypothetical protein
MTKDELLSSLNAEVGPGSVLVTPRMLKDWVEESLLEPPIRRGLGRGKGTEWIYSSDAADRCVSIIKFKSWGVSRYPLLRLYMWVFGFSIPTASLKSALKIEFDKLRIRQSRSSRAYPNLKSDGSPTHRSIEIANRDLESKLDPVLAATGFGPSSDTLARVGSTMFSGDELTGRTTDEVQTLAPMFRGLMGDEQEIEGSFSQILADISDDELESGKQYLLMMFFGSAMSFAFAPADGTPDSSCISAAAHLKIFNSLFEPEWCVSILAQGAVAAARDNMQAEKT